MKHDSVTEMLPEDFPGKRVELRARRPLPLYPYGEILWAYGEQVYYAPDLGHPTYIDARDIKRVIGAAAERH